MKKLLLLFMLSFSVFFALPAVSAVIETVIYDFTYIDDYRYTLDTGTYTPDQNYAATDRLILQNNSITCLTADFHHVLFWGNNNSYIGYYNNTGATTLEGPGFLGYTGGLTFLAPANTKTFAFVVNKYGPDTVIPDLSPETYDTIFSAPLYGSYTDSILPDTLSNSYQNTTSYNLIQNGRFSWGNTGTQTPLYWSAGSGSSGFTWSTGSTDMYRAWSEADGTGGRGQITTTLNLATVIGHLYYLQADQYIFDASAGSLDELEYTFGGESTSNGSPSFGSWTTFNDGLTASSASTAFSIAFSSDSTITQAYMIDNVAVYDLTAIFGSGNEPTIIDFYTNYLPYYSFGDSYYDIENIADSSNVSYATLVTNMSVSSAVPTYALTRILPTNMISNPGFTDTTPANGLGDGWFLIYSDTPSISSGYQYFQSDGTNARSRIQDPGFTVVSGSKYFISANIQVPTGYYARIAPNFSSGSTDVLNGGYVSGVYTSVVSQSISSYFGSIRDLSGTTAQNDGDITGVKNAKVYNISSLISSGLFVGMSDNAIKTVLDDYAVNGLTASNMGYFFDGPAAWDSLSISDKNLILSYYGTAYAGGDVIDFSYNYFDELFYISQHGTDFSGVVIFPKELTDKQQWYGVDNSVIDTQLYIGETPTDFTDLSYTDLDKWGIQSWRAGLSVSQRDYYDLLYHDALDTVDRWEWYNDKGVTGANFAAIQAMKTWLETYYNPGISFVDFQTIDPNYDRDFTPYVPEEVDDKINNWFDDLGLGTFPKILTAIVLMILIAVVLGFLHAGRIIYFVLEGILFILFSIIGWFPVWLVVVFAAIIFILFIRAVFHGNSGGE